MISHSIFIMNISFETTNLLHLMWEGNKFSQLSRTEILGERDIQQGWHNDEWLLMIFHMKTQVLDMFFTLETESTTENDKLFMIEHILQLHNTSNKQINRFQISTVVKINIPPKLGPIIPYHYLITIIIYVIHSKYCITWNTHNI